MQNKTKSVNKVKKRQVDFVLIVIIIILLLFGIVMILSASAPSALAETGSSYTYVISQIQFAVLGLVVMWIASKFDYRIYQKLYWPIYWFSVGILLLVLIPGLGSSGGGASRWINLGFTQFQPSEITKIGLIIFYAGYLTDHKNDLKSFKKGFILDPWQDPTDKGWQTIQGLYAIGSGGLFGVGLGESKQKYLYVSEPQNDFIFSILAEELGFVGCVVVIILFALFIWRGIIIAMKAQDMFGSLLATGITTLVMVQVALNIGVVTNSIPNTGISLPFFSAGGTALIMLLGMCGILLNISKSKAKV